MNFAKFNHVLIPATKDERDRLRTSRLGRALGRPIVWGFRALTDEGRFLLVFALLAGITGLDLERTQNYLLWCAVFAAIVASVAVRPFFRMHCVRLGVETPRRVAVDDEVSLLLTLVNDADRDHHTVRIERPLLPWDGKWTGPAPAIRTLAPRSRRTVTVGARFSQRGHHHLDPFTAAATVPLGIAQGRPITSRGARLLVTPRVAPVRSLRLPLLHRYQPGGVGLASKTGESMELLGVRPYRSGDRIRDLHAKSWARIGAPVVREYQQEYFTRVAVIVDTDATVAGARALEAAVSLAAGIVTHLSRGEALIDLLVTGEPLCPLTVGRSLGSPEQALDHLACVEAGPPFDAEALLDRLSPYLPQLSAVVLVALGWDGSRRVFAERVQSKGPGCRVVTLQDGPVSGHGDPTFLPPERVESGRAIRL